MIIKKVFFLLLITAVVLLPAVGCGEKKYEALELVPAGVDMIVGIELSRAVQQLDLYSETEEGAEMTEQVGDMMDELSTQLGVDPRDVAEAVIFGDLSSLDTSEYMGFIMVGDFEDVDIIDRIEEESGMEFTGSQYGGYTLYTDREQAGAVVVINKSMVIIGAVEAVRDCIDVAGGKVERVSGAVLDTYNGLGEAMVRLAMAVPPDFREGLAEEPVEEEGMPFSVRAFEDIQTLGLALDQTAEVMTVDINAGFGGAQSAVDAADAIDGIISFLRGTATEQQLKDFLNRIEVTPSGSWVYISFTVSLDELKELQSSFMTEAPEMPEMPEMPESD